MQPQHPQHPQRPQQPLGPQHRQGPESPLSRPGVESFVLTVAVTMVAAAAVLVGATWKHLRARQISPADSPILVE